MDRRSFMRTIAGGLVAGAAVRTWPFRVYSFPTEIREYTDFRGLTEHIGWQIWGKPYHDVRLLLYFKPFGPKVESL